MLIVAAVFPNGYDFDISGQLITLFNRLIGLFVYPAVKNITFILGRKLGQCRYGVIGALCQQFLNGSHRGFISAGVGTGGSFGGFLYLKAWEIGNGYYQLVVRLFQHGDGFADCIFAGSADTLSFALERIARSDHSFPFSQLMSCLLDYIAAVIAFLPMFVSGALILIIMLNRLFLSVYPAVSAGAAVGGITAGGTGSFGHGRSIIMGVPASQHRDLSLFGIAAVKALDRKDARFGRGRIFGYLSAAENMYINVYPFSTIISADKPVLLGIISYFRRVCFTVTSRSAVVRCPFAAFKADAVAASVAFGSFRAAIHTQAAIGTGFDTVFTAAALAADSGAVGTDSLAAYAYLRSAIGAESALFAHRIGTVGAFAAIRAVYVGTFRAFAAVTAPHIGTVFTDISALTADCYAVSALSAPFTEGILSRTFDAHITGHTEGVTACRAFFSAFRAKIGAFFTSFSTGTGCDTLAALGTVCAPSVSLGAGYTPAAF